MNMKFTSVIKLASLLVVLTGATISLASCSTPGGSNDGYSAPPPPPSRGSH